jgi:hypothetical protein
MNHMPAICKVDGNAHRQDGLQKAFLLCWQESLKPSQLDATLSQDAAMGVVMEGEWPSLTLIFLAGGMSDISLHNYVPN